LSALDDETIGGRREELTARAAVAGGSTSGAATVALHVDGWGLVGWLGGGDVKFVGWFVGVACDDDGMMG
jgi:hypothetical protein